NGPVVVDGDAAREPANVRMRGVYAAVDDPDGDAESGAAGERGVIRADHELRGACSRRLAHVALRKGDAVGAGLSAPGGANSRGNPPARSLSSSGGPLATIRPSCSTTARSALRATSKLCVMMIIVTPSRDRSYPRIARASESGSR